MIVNASGRDALRLCIQHHEDLHQALRDLHVDPPDTLIAYLDGMRALAALGDEATEAQIRGFLDGVNGALHLIAPTTRAPKPGAAADDAAFA